MPEFLSDTPSEVADLQIEKLRSATVQQRADMMRSLTQMAVRNSKRAIRRARPELSDREQKLLFIELNYGAELAAMVRTQWKA